MRIGSLKNIDHERIASAFMEAFADYDFQLNAEELKTMWKRRGFFPDLSFAVFDGNDIVAFTLNAIGYFNGRKIAYDTGTGTLKQFRGQGLAKQIFEYSIPFLKNEGIDHYLLEVLQHNEKAVSVYRKIGFEVTRELNYFIWKNEEHQDEFRISDLNYIVKPIDIDQYPTISDFWDFHPSWQNSLESVRRTKDAFINLGVFENQKLLGYCIFEPNSGDITQIAVDKSHRRKGVASELLYELKKFNKCPTTKLVNTDINCSSIIHFLQSKGIGISGKQFEMMKKI